MRNQLFIILVIFSVLAFAGTGWALTIDAGAIEVGGLDPFTGYSTTLPDYNPSTVEDWIQTILGEDWTFDDKWDFNETNPSDDWIAVDDSDYWAWQFPEGDEPDAFWVKWGAGQTYDAVYLYTNVEELNWAVLYLPTINLRIDDWGTISHIGWGGGSTQVPEPGSLLLLGVGMVGLVGFRRNLS